MPYSAARSGVSAAALMLLPLGILLILAWAYVLGSVIVRDADRSLAGVALSNGHDHIAVRRLLGDLYITSVKLEGEAVLRCRNGRAVSLGYITTATHMSYTASAATCRPEAPAVPNL